MVERPPPLLTENQPLCIIRITAFQISDSSYGSFLDHHAIFNGKSCLTQTIIVAGIAIKPGKEIGMSILFQYPVTLMGEPFIVNPVIPFKYRMPGSGELILIRNPIWRICQDHGNETVWYFCKQVHTVHAVNLVTKICSFQNKFHIKRLIFINKFHIKLTKQSMAPPPLHKKMPLPFTATASFIQLYQKAQQILLLCF